MWDVATDDRFSTAEISACHRGKRSTGGYLVEAIGSAAPRPCVHCSSALLYRHGSVEQDYQDTPSHGRAVTIRVTRQRFRCQQCTRTQSEEIPDLDDRRLATRRLLEYLWFGRHQTCGWRCALNALIFEASCPLEISGLGLFQVSTSSVKSARLQSHFRSLPSRRLAGRIPHYSQNFGCTPVPAANGTEWLSKAPAHTITATPCQSPSGSRREQEFGIPLGTSHCLGSEE